MSPGDTLPIGVTRMSESEIGSFISHRNVGVLGLPDQGAPYLIPMSFTFDDEQRLFFTFVLGTNSRKEALADRAEQASFLVYDATSAFIWESVVLTGELTQLADDEEGEVREVIDGAWRPEAFRNAGPGRETKLFEFRIDERIGLKGTGLPTELDGEES